MHPILFHIGDFPIGTYGLLLALAFFAASWLAQRQAKLDGIEPEFISELAVALLVAGIVGSKLLMVGVGLLTSAGQEGAMTFGDIFSLGTLRAGGAVHGGLIAATLVFFWKVRRKGVEPALVLDALVPAVALGQGIGRLGCLMAGCCYGTVCDKPWAITFHGSDVLSQGTPIGIPLHPVQLYTLAGNLAVMALLLLLRKRRAFHGQVGAAFFMLEGLQRLVVETWRGDLDRGTWMGLSWLSTGRMTAIGFMAFGLGWYLWRKRKIAAA